MSGSGRLIGVGVGPGDPELLTLKAVRALEHADVVAHFLKAGRTSHARRAALPHLRPGTPELPLAYPVTTEIPREAPAYAACLSAFYDASAKTLAQELDAGRRVVVLSEGDPFFYGSYMHLHVRLCTRYPTEVVPGITSASGCWSEAGVPIAQGEDVLSIVPATLPEDELVRRFASSDALVVIKLGRHREKVRRALARAGRLERSLYVERGTTPEAKHLPLAESPAGDAPYFALVLVPGWADRP